jgi:hypothetical protein
MQPTYVCTCMLIPEILYVGKKKKDLFLFRPKLWIDFNHHVIEN